jgi:hypothetical protein
MTDPITTAQALTTIADQLWWLTWAVAAIAICCK